MLLGNSVHFLSASYIFGQSVLLNSSHALLLHFVVRLRSIPQYE